MPRRPRLRRTLKWIGTIAAISMLLGACATIRWDYVSLRRTTWYAGLWWGQFSFYWYDERDCGIGWYIHTRDTGAATWKQLADEWAGAVEWPSYEANLWGMNPSREIHVPLSIPFLLLAIPTAMLWRLDRRRPLPNHCRNCNYNLTGNTSGRCPECGAPDPQPSTQA